MIGMAETATTPPDDLRRHDGMTTSCKTCEHAFSTSVRGNTVRCPSCKTPNYIPKTARATAEVIPLRADDRAPAWDPAPVHVVELEDADADCPDCGTPLVWSPGGTLHYCETCEAPVFPAALLPDVDAEDPRRVPTRTERDLAAIALAQRKGVMLAQLDRLADDDRLDPASLPVVEWFRDEVKAAATGGRLDELAALLPQAGIRRRHWWHGRPALDPAGYLDDEDDGDDLDEDQADEDDADELPAAGSPVRALTAAGLDHAGIVRANGFYDPDPAAPAGQCQVINRRSGMTGEPYPSPVPCYGGAFHTFGPFRLCPTHYQQFTR